MQVLVIAEHDELGIKATTLSTVTAARAFGGDVHVLVTGHDVGDAAAAAARIAGVARVLVVDGDQFAHNLAEVVAAQVHAIAADYGHILFPSTVQGRNAAPRVAAMLDVAQISDVIKVIDPNTFERPIYAGNAIATVRSVDSKKVITVRTTAFDPAPTADDSVAINSVIGVPASDKSRFVSSEFGASGRPDLATARIVIAGGRALGSRESFWDVLTPLADKLGAAIGASRAAVDAGYAPNDLQVGQTGKIVAPRLYIATGISGAIQHLAGMKDSEVIVAINKDAEAPIFSVADYGLEADLFVAVPQLLDAL